MLRLPLALAALLLAVPACPAALPAARPAEVGLSAERLGRIDGAVQRAVDRGEIPGAVVLVARRGRVAFRKAYGRRAKQPAAAPMTADTVFDLASLTKPVATATAVMQLVEQGRFSPADPVRRYWPEFAAAGKGRVTVEQLLLHTSGLVADNPEADFRDGKAKALERIAALEPVNPAGSKFVYSDVNYIVLGELVERLTKTPLDAYTREHVFAPLGMADTGFRPGPKLRERCAPTERVGDHWLVGEVHDPRARLLGGVAGHAGLFGTADDLAVYAKALLDGGAAANGRRVLASLTVQAMTRPRPVPGGLRAYGWDVHTAFSTNRGDLFDPDGGFGHTGFTGTSLWIDTATEMIVILLTNRVHPDGKAPTPTRLRREVATLAAAAVERAGHGERREVLCGIDVLERDSFASLKGCRVGLVTNHTGLDRAGRATADLLHKAPGLTLVALFSPEHGIRGTFDEKVADSKDEKTGLPVYSLYGARRKPTAETLKGVDTLVFDVQDVGCRFYTYNATLAGVLEAASEHGLRVVVLDRPNPIGGVAVEGPVLDAGRESFVAFHTVPVRFGLTVGETARLLEAERKLTCGLEVVRVEGWRRGDLYDRTGLYWVNPSPNLRGLAAALLYPGVGLLETTNVSVGRGTDRPFEWVGAPWVDGQRLAAELAKEDLPGVRFMPLRMTPTYSTHKGTACDGVQILVDDWSRLRPVRTGLALACVLRRLYPNDWKTDRYDVLLGHKATWDGIQRGAGWRELEKAWEPELARYRERVAPHLLYAE